MVEKLLHTANLTEHGRTFTTAAYREEEQTQHVKHIDQHRVHTGVFGERKLAAATMSASAASAISSICIIHHILCGI